MAGIVIEACCASAGDVRVARDAGFDRVELNSAMYFGGLTPSMGELCRALEVKGDMKVIAMVRPRQGGFCYDDDEFSAMLYDAKSLIKAGADGVAFGILKIGENGAARIDVERCRRLIELVGEYGGECVFHRAFDMLTDETAWRGALDALMELRVTRLLTSGHATNALAGAERIKKLIAHIGGAFSVMPGGGVRVHNAPEIVRLTGCTELHTSGSERVMDGSSMLNPVVKFMSENRMLQGEYTRLKKETLADFSRCVKGRV